MGFQATQPQVTARRGCFYVSRITRMMMMIRVPMPMYTGVSSP
jgi:hypothetical protein